MVLELGWLTRQRHEASSRFRRFHALADAGPATLQPDSRTLSTTDHGSCRLETRPGIQGPEGALTTIDVQVFGGLAVTRDGEAVPPAAFRGRLARTLLRMLVVDRGSVITRDALIDALWGDDTPDDADANLNVLANRVRRALGEPDVILTADGGYALTGDPRFTVDAEIFLTYVDTGLRFATDRQPAACIGELETALAMWSEPLPEDAYHDWAQPFRQRMERARDEALRHAAEAALALHDVARARSLASELAAAHPLSEPAQLLLTRSLAASGDTAAALESFDAWRARLAEDLGLDPSVEATALHQRLLRGEALRTPNYLPPAVRPVRLADELVFVGRDAELNAVLEAVGPAHAGSAVIRGHAGSGKSRLLAEVERRVHGVPVLHARSFPADRERPWGLARGVLRQALERQPDATLELPARMLDALGDVVPEVVTEPPGPTHAETRRVLAFESALRVLELASDGGGALVVCDDVQWADATSLELLSAMRARQATVGLLLAYRPDEIAATPAAAGLLAALESDERTLTVDLPPLSTDGISTLVEDAELVEVLASDTDGSPMAIGEVLRALERAGRVRRTPDGLWRTVGPSARQATRAIATAGQRRAIAARVAQQPRLRRDLLGLLALLAREARSELLAEAAGIPPREALEHLQALALAALAHVTDRGWTAVHDLVAETVADHLDAAHRARLHALLALALEREGADVAELARQRAGAGDAEGAAADYARAAADRLAHSATDEAFELAEAGLALGGTRASRAALLRSRAEARATRGDLSGAADDLKAALDSAVSGAEQARILARMTLMAAGVEDLERARGLADTALVAAGRDRSARAVALAAAAVVDMNTGHTDRADARSTEAQQLYTELGDVHGVACIVDDRVMASFLGGAITEAVVAFDRAAGLLLDSGDLLRVVYARSTRGHALVFADDAGAGLDDSTAAVQLAVELGYPEGEAYARWHRSEALAALGRAEEALADAERAQAISTRIRHRGWKAMSLRARGIARVARGDLAGAAEDFAASLDTGEGIPLFTAWACSQLATVQVRRGELRAAASLVRRALAEAPPLAGYEARLAAVELAVARDDDDAIQMARHALSLAVEGGHHASARRLGELGGRVTP